MSKESSVVTTADILALAAIGVAMLFGAIALHLWINNQRLTKDIKQSKELKARITQTIECR